MEKLSITVLDEKGLDSQRVTVASDAEAGQVIATLVRLMEMPTKNPDGTPITYALRLGRTGLQISGVRTMAEFGVRDGDFLRLGVKTKLPTAPDLTLDPEGLINPQPRPWRRYWARFFDNYVFNLSIGIFVALAVPGLLLVQRLLIGFLVQPVYCVLEAALLATFGTTLGKALFNVSVRKVDGNRLSIGEAVVRAFQVWAMGFGLGIPIVSLVTCIIGYNTLRTEGTTPWDRRGGFRVTYGEIGAGRMILIILLAILFITLQFI